ncbi:MAG: hypothetical protein JW846_07565 [Dehalococcoidia bacterium]|nr:hypothetical protein [Dehalococcoidia bacterium]
MLHLDTLVQLGVFLVCFGVFVWLSSKAALNMRLSRQVEKKHDKDRKHDSER